MRGFDERRPITRERSRPGRHGGVVDSKNVLAVDAKRGQTEALGSSRDIEPPPVTTAVGVSTA